MPRIKLTLGRGTRKSYAEYDAGLFRLKKRASKARDTIARKERKGQVVTRRDTASAHRAFEAFRAALAPYIAHAKRHRHPARMIVAPRNLRPFLKGDLVQKTLRITLERLEPDYRWAITCLDKLKKPRAQSYGK